MKFQTLVLVAVLTTIISLSAQTSSDEADLQRAKQQEAASGDCKAVLPEDTRDRRAGIQVQPAGRCRGVAPEGHLS